MGTTERLPWTYPPTGASMAGNGDAEKGDD